DITITYKRDGRYDEAALKKLDWFMRDWRKEQETHMDPHLFDLLWETDREVGGKEPIQVICGYRSPGTNAMLRERSTGVAQFSQHINGQAIDFYIPGVPLEKIRAVGLWLQRGGVGFYPTSGSPFVHLDTGSVRHWPQIARQDLVKIFPDGRTVHIPSDGHPLPGYRLALADVERRGAVPSEKSLEAAREAGIITASDEEYAMEVPKHPSLLARLFGSRKDNVEDSAPAPKRVRSLLASLNPVRQAVAAERNVPLPAARPAPVPAAAAPTQEETFVTASLGGNWRGKIEKGPDRAAPANVAAAAPTALAFAEETPIPIPAPARLRPMGSNLPQLPAEATLIPASSNSTVMTASALAGGKVNYDSPWLRAAMLTPSVSGMMTASHAGESFNAKALEPLLHKPSMALAMTFSADPNYGMVADRFSGRAVVFLATTTFVRQTLSMR
ncbi:MAG TPA: DUF882 domain-containing protein, partial [Pseudolabrys sp.]|nr:DUF882 domain-containing protein [Pseudolabrys sp.]